MASRNNKDPIMDYFKKGAEVEISSNDNGFRGSWYTGSVVRKTRNGKALVEYETLMEDESGKRKLREELDIVQLRPPAPRESYREFKFSEEVDVYHNDGWWEGVITEVLKDGKFSVYFRASREQLEFPASVLRLHREWVYGKWEPLLEMEAKDKEVSLLVKEKPSKETFQENFSQGAHIEVRTDEEGFEGAWLPAIIMEQLDKDKYLVQYKSLKNDEDADFLIEEADSLSIRPHPPDTVFGDSFKVHEKVDALFNDCWWEGVISKVLKGNKYIVYFEKTKDEMEFRHSDLRQHQDWIDGQWIIPSQAMEL
ncbi:hypothetical protein ACH5RR_001668 [Cinchona calisaya]|uniref:Agenet domain-containing protein n=1 Tax=Cinchona calisaya TaxID=153742 RepID=A0ABD3B5A1_9GENT